MKKKMIALLFNEKTKAMFQKAANSLLMTIMQLLWAAFLLSIGVGFLFLCGHFLKSIF